jgi:N6-L-threonylcarbamoyladenine synthase/protein kinase Bud32
MIEKGAEAVIIKTKIFGMPAIRKFRVEKKYREKELDFQLRYSRTRREARLLQKAKQAKIICPVVYFVDDFSIYMKFLKGKMLNQKKINKKEISEAAKILAKLHSLNIIHGDFTLANLMATKSGLAVIDFGLGFISNDLEDKATDVLVMYKSAGKFGDFFLKQYEKYGEKAVLKTVKNIQLRIRYAKERKKKEEEDEENT